MPAVAPPVEKVVWRELFKYPRSVAAGCLAGLSGTGITGFLLWQVTLFVMVLHVTPAQASGLVIWLSLGQIVGRFFCSWISAAMGRRASIALTGTIAGVAMSLAGYWHDLFLGGFSVFYLMIMVQQFFGSGAIRSSGRTWRRSGRPGCAPAAWAWPMAPAISASSSVQPGWR